jgi:hypothetical protein
MSARLVDGPAMANCEHCEVMQQYLETDSWLNLTDNTNKDRIPFTSHQCKPHFTSAMGSIYTALRN